MHRSRASAPVASFSFDDFPRSAGQEGAKILERYGARGTYFVCGGRMGKHEEGLDHFTQSDLVELAKAGHEIGCHTYSHLCLPAATTRDIHEDIARNERFIQDVLGDYRMCSFAYPWGCVSIRTKRMMARRFPISRGTNAAVNAGRIDFAQLSTIPLQQPFNCVAIRHALDEAVAQNGWLIFVAHDVSRDPHQYGCRPDELETAVRAVVDRGMEILPIKDAAIRTGFSVPRA